MVVDVVDHGSKLARGGLEGIYLSHQGIWSDVA